MKDNTEDRLGSSRIQIFYFHGGPGLNSHPGEQMLSDIFDRAGWDVRFWNEPSRLRPSGPAWVETDAFENYLLQAERFLLANQNQETVVAIGHSFGAHVVRYLTKKHPKRLRMCVFIAPDLAIEQTDKNMFDFTMEDYQRSRNPAAAELQLIMKNYSGAFDKNTARGFELVVQNPSLFDHYWVDQQIKETFLQYFRDPGYGLDVESFFAVRKSLSDIHLQECDVPALAVFGKHDVVISDAAEIEKLKQHYKRVTIRYFENSAHYPHFEESDRFCELLRNELHEVSSRTHN